MRTLDGFITCWIAAALATGCADAEEFPDEDGAGGAGAEGGAGGSGGVILPTGGAGGEATNPTIFAHTDQVLFTIQPSSIQSGSPMLTQIGAFDCVGGAVNAMTDVAVGGDALLWGISADDVWPLDQAGCGAAIPLNNPDGVRFYGLTFAPVGVVDPSSEILIGGNTSGELWAIDAAGELSLRGTFGAVPADDGNGNAYDAAHVGKLWELSGDIVFVEGDGAPLGFATVRDCPNPPSTTGCNEINTLLEIDVTKLGQVGGGSVTKSVRGQIRKRPGCDDATDGNYGNMYGIAAVGGSVYGFSRSGNIVDIDIDDGSACLVASNPQWRFSGAGVTTQAFVETPVPK